MMFRRNAAKEQERRYFTAARDAMALPDLIEVQKASYRWFLEEGIRELMKEISPIKDFIGRDLELFFVDYYIDEPKFDEKTSKEKNVNFEAPLRVKTRLVNKRTGIDREQEVYLGDIPVMTERGTFIVNGIERVAVSQLVRSADAVVVEDNVAVGLGAALLKQRTRSAVQGRRPRRSRRAAVRAVRDRRCVGRVVDCRAPATATATVSAPAAAVSADSLNAAATGEFIRDEEN
jgi:DNA-directed RNA polymerase beta subunit